MYLLVLRSDSCTLVEAPNIMHSYGHMRSLSVAASRVPAAVVVDEIEEDGEALSVAGVTSRCRPCGPP